MTITIVKCQNCGKWRGTIRWSKSSTCAFCGKRAKHDNPKIIKYHPKDDEKHMEMVAKFNREGR